MMKLKMKLAFVLVFLSVLNPSSLWAEEPQEDFNVVQARIDKCNANPSNCADAEKDNINQLLNETLNLINLGNDILRESKLCLDAEKKINNRLLECDVQGLATGIAAVGIVSTVLVSLEASRQIAKHKRLYDLIGERVKVIDTTSHARIFANTVKPNIAKKYFTNATPYEIFVAKGNVKAMNGLHTSIQITKVLKLSAGVLSIVALIADVGLIGEKIFSQQKPEAITEPTIEDVIDTATQSIALLEQSKRDFKTVADNMK